MSLRGKVTLVTGADGFIGSHLVDRLVADGANVRALCCYNSNGSLGWLDEMDRDLLSGVDVRLGDIRDSGFVDDVVEGCEVVLHLAALISIPYSYQAPRAFAETNVLGTLNVLEGSRRHGVARMVHTSTSEVYGTPLSTPITEAHPLMPQSPYAATKVGADMLAYAWSRSFDLPVVCLRPFNTYGPRQSARAIIPTVLGQLLAGCDELRVGSVTPRRDFTFVTDTVDGFVRATEVELESGSTVQLGTGRTVSVADIIEMAFEVVGRRVPVREDDRRMRPPRSEVEVLISDPSRAAELLGWTSTVGLEEGLHRTAHWLAGRVDAASATRYLR